MGVDPKELRNALRGLAGATTAVADQAGAMTDAELSAVLLSGRWTTIEVHEAGRRLAARGAAASGGAAATREPE